MHICNYIQCNAVSTSLNEKLIKFIYKVSMLNRQNDLKQISHKKWFVSSTCADYELHHKLKS